VKVTVVKLKSGLLLVIFFLSATYVFVPKILHFKLILFSEIIYMAESSKTEGSF